MKKYANYYYDGKIKHNKNRLDYYKDNNNYLFSYGIYKTKIKAVDLPDYFVKIWLYPRYKYISLKGIKDLYYRPSFFTNHWRKDDLLYLSYGKNLDIDESGYVNIYDEIIYGPEIDHFIEEISKYGYNKSKLDEIKKLMNKKDKWYKYWKEHDWDGCYSYTSDEVWKEILGDIK